MGGFLKRMVGLGLCALCAFSFLRGQEGSRPLNRILLIYDASNSMNARWQSASKMSISKRLIAEIVDSLSGLDNVQLALRVYGHQSHYPPLDCNDSKLEVPFSSDNAKKIIQVIKGLVPKGATPIAYSLTEAANDFPPCEDCRNLIILITDGIEECGGDPCEASRILQKQGIALKPFIIGIGKDFSNEFQCVGEYFDAADENDFVRAFEIVISQALNNTTAQVNLLDTDGSPTVTNLNMTFYDHVSGNVVYNYVHTLNYYGRPDTLTLDPLHVYDMVVHTLPPLRKDSIVVRTGRHNTIAIPAAQGNLLVSMKGSRASVTENTPCVIRKPGQTEIVNVQYINANNRYLAGKYDVDILTLPPVSLKNVEISPNKTTTIDLPMLGILVFKRNGSGYGTLYSLESEKEQKLVYNFSEDKSIETLYLRPGTYRIVYRSRYNLRTSATREKTFVLKPGATVDVNL
ncbi:MAG: VWA domain-containing protein [Lentimicrobiaceae bacterium]|nr:VWA domain-containing protein [Lentimicrobiaceae bacterium]